MNWGTALHTEGTVAQACAKALSWGGTAAELEELMGGQGGFREVNRERAAPGLDYPRPCLDYLRQGLDYPRDRTGVFILRFQDSSWWASIWGNRVLKGQLWWPRGQREVAHPRVRQEARLTEEEEVWSGEWLAFSEQATPAHRDLDYKPQPHGHPQRPTHRGSHRPMTLQSSG